MKPSLDEVLEKIVVLAAIYNKGKKLIYIDHLVDELETHKENLMPSLYLLRNDGIISFSSDELKAFRIEEKEKAA